MRGINGKPVVDMIPYMGEAFLDLYCDWGPMSAAIASTQRQVGLWGVGALPNDNRKDIRFAQKEIEALPPDDPSRKLYDSLPNMSAKRYWLKLTHGSYSGYETIYLRKPKFIEDKFNPERCQWVEAASKFQSVLKFCDALCNELEVFAGIGRVGLFITEHDCVTLTHKDNLTAEYKPHNHEFIWCNISNKTLFVYDPETGMEYDTESNVVFFNDMDYHGGHSSDKMAVSLRIDGQFTPTMRKILGVDEHNPEY